MTKLRADSPQVTGINLCSVGSRNLFDMDVLPTNMNGFEVEGRKILEDAGAKFLGVDEGAGELQHVELPSGWEKRKTDSYNRYDLFDPQERKRAMIVYRFYGGGWGLRLISIHMRFLQRYNVVFLCRRYDREYVAVSHVIDEGRKGSDRVLFTTEPLERYNPDGMEYAHRAEDRSKAQAVAWLDEHYADWRDAGAYWD